MVWSDGFVAAFSQVASPKAKLGGILPKGDESPADLATGYSAVVKRGEDARSAAIRLKGLLESSAMGADAYFAEILWGVENAIIAAQQRTPPRTMEEAGGILLPQDFSRTFAFSTPDLGQAHFKLGDIHSLPDGHWGRDVLFDDDCMQADGVPCLFIGEGRIIHVSHSVEITRKLRRVQREAEETYRREAEQAEARARAEWENSPNGRIAALEKLVRDLQGQLQSQPAAG